MFRQKQSNKTDIYLFQKFAKIFIYTFILSIYGDQYRHILVCLNHSQLTGWNGKLSQLTNENFHPQPPPADLQLPADLQPHADLQLPADLQPPVELQRLDDDLLPLRPSDAAANSANAANAATAELLRRPCMGRLEPCLEEKMGSAHTYYDAIPANKSSRETE